jgi:hypothetical protein
MPKPLIAIVLFCFALALMPSPARALSDAEKLLWRECADTPTAFTVPVSQGPSVMAKAKDLVANWTNVESGMWATPIHSADDNTIETDAPTANGEVSFKVTRTSSGPVDLIAIDTSACTIHILSAHNEEVNARKRGRALSYLLQQYAATLPGAPAPAPAAESQVVGAPVVAAAAAAAAAPDPLQSLVQALSSQIAGGNYDAALSTIDTLKSAVRARQRAQRN